jgi:hypothetical protein
MNLNIDKYAKGSYSKMVLYMIGGLSVMLIMGFLFSGCDLQNVAGGETGNGNGTGNENDNASLSMMVSQSDDPSNTLTLSEAKFLITEVYFRRTDGTQGEIHVAPVLVNLDISGSATVVTSGSIPAGTYNRLKFNVHKVEDYEIPPDPEFKIGNSGNQRFSLIAKGTFNGSSFVFRSRKSMNLELNFAAPVTISGNERINMTVSLNPFNWFFSNGSYLNPSIEDNEDTIEDNIKSSFRNVFINNP